MLAADFIKKYPSACEEAVEWINSLGEGVTAEEAWEICPNEAWMAWAASMAGVPEEERWVWADLARVWVADILDREGVGHKLRECSPVVDEDSARAVCSATANVHASSAFYAARAAINCSSYVAAYATVSSVDFASPIDANYPTDKANMIRERIKNPFRRD